jgi:hypothetical protein
MNASASGAVMSSPPGTPAAANASASGANKGVLDGVASFFGVGGARRGRKVTRKGRKASRKGRKARKATRKATRKGRKGRKSSRRNRH